MARDQQAFTELFCDIEPRLRRAFTAAFGMERGHDATAEALAGPGRTGIRVAAMHNPAGYLWRVGRSRSRSAKKVPFLLPEPGPDDPLIEPSLIPALRALTLRQRTTVLLVHGYGWQLHEVAELLGLKVTTVQNHVDRDEQTAGGDW